MIIVIVTIITEVYVFFLFVLNNHQNLVRKVENSKLSAQVYMLAAFIANYSLSESNVIFKDLQYLTNSETKENQA